ncbi:MAG: biotin--[acetyl-CoA-carboxylase] ligase [Lachnospiraceae bacterium]|nr:biotin--[acetyl-CoA-carboxylase] ligase [Lachnospiraceae bacterium]
MTQTDRILLDPEDIHSRLTREGVGCPLFYRQEIDSTNEWAKRAAAEGAADGSVYLADYQSAGKGRRGRTWQSPEGTSVSMSLLLRPEIPADRISMLTLIMGLSAAEGMKAVTGLDVGIKWPNDVVIGGRKLCGILTEANSLVEYIVVGIGINCNMEAFPEELSQTATSLRLEMGRPVSREAVTAEILKAFYRNYEEFRKTCTITGSVKEAYEDLLVNRDRQVRVLDPKGEYEGISLGINEMGELLVQRADNGEAAAVYAGEVSVRGIYGYV